MNVLFLSIYVNLIIVVGQVPGLFAKETNGTVFGYIFNASKESETLNRESQLIPAKEAAGHKVILHKYIDGKEVENALVETIVDARGRFEFQALQMGERYAYYPVTFFEGVEYYGEVVTLKPDSIQKQSDIFVFETTDSDSNIIVDTHHIILKPAVGALTVREFYLFANRSNQTYVGNLPAGSQNKRVVLDITVPEKATDVKFGGDLMSCCAVTSKNHIFDTMAFKPGMRQIVVNYLLPYAGKVANLERDVNYHTKAADIFLPDNFGELTASGFEKQPPFQIRDQSYQRLSKVDLKKGSNMTVAIAGLSAPPKDLKWTAPVVLTLLVVAIYLMQRRRKSNQLIMQSNIQKNEIAKELHRILDEIKQLEEAYKAGSIDEETYLSSKDNLTQLVSAIEDIDSSHANFVEPKLEDKKPCK